jgi:hypothetical protein
VPNSRIYGIIHPFPFLFKERGSFSNSTTYFETDRRKSVAKKKPDCLNSDMTKIKPRIVISQSIEIHSVSILEIDLVKKHGNVNKEN